MQNKHHKIEDLFFRYFEQQKKSKKARRPIYYSLAAINEVRCDVAPMFREEAHMDMDEATPSASGAKKKCPFGRLLVFYLERKLEQDEMDAMDRHIATCPQCREALEFCEKLSDPSEGPMYQDVADDLSASLDSRIRKVIDGNKLKKNKKSL